MRLIAATNRDLDELIQEHKFRSDLYYRHYVQHFSNRLGKTIDTIPAETMDTLVQYPWLGNVRELQNVLERASILAPDQILRISRDRQNSRSWVQEARRRRFDSPPNFNQHLVSTTRARDPKPFDPCRG